jgi:phenylpyruvate tautomerase PptA (4-oxalocrotonate tautomerase family)
MPMWKVYYSEGAYTAEDKQEFAEAITGLYTQFNLPAFYVTALFHELPADMFYVGGEQASGYIRIWVDHIARRIPDDSNRFWMVAVNKMIAPFTAARGHRWEVHIDNTPMELWTIDGFYPPPADSDEEKRWARDNRPSPPLETEEDRS